MTDSPAHPWQSLSVPVHPKLSARHASRHGGVTIWWALDAKQTPILLLEFTGTTASEPSAPRLRALAVTSKRVKADAITLTLALLDNEKVDIFSVLCDDLIATTQSCSTSDEALRLVLQRVWRWHRLLSGKTRGLSRQEQAGLFAELYTLSQTLFPILGEERSVNAWLGPHGGIQDFDLGRLRLECKALIGERRHEVRINSAEQLSWDQCDVLILRTVMVRDGDEHEPDCWRVSGFANHLLQRLEASVPHVALRFIETLMEAGITPGETPEYESFWVAEDVRSYHVRDGFPCILRSAVHPSILKLTYTLDRSSCEPWFMNESDLNKLLRGS